MILSYDSYIFVFFISLIIIKLKYRQSQVGTEEIFPVTMDFFVQVILILLILFVLL